MYTLFLLSDNQPMTAFSLEGETSIGRSSSCTLHMLDTHFSRRHAVVRETDNGLWLEDLNSRNGTYVNGTPIGQPVRLHDGDSFQVGCHTFIVNPDLSLLRGDGADEPLLLFSHTDDTVMAEEAGANASEVADVSSEDWAFVHGLTLELLSRSNPGEMLQLLLEQLIAQFTAQRGFVLLRQRPSGQWKVAAVKSDGRPMGFSRALLQRVVDTGAPLRLANGIDRVSFENARSVVEQNLRSVMLAPLMADGQVHGVIQLDSPGVNVWDAGDLQRLRLVAQSASVAFGNLRAQTQQQHRQMQAAIGGGTHFVGQHPLVQALLKNVHRAAATDVRVLIEGESGTGKELIARMLHEQSMRADGPFVALNCAAIPENLIESELFGYEKGAFTGAARRKAGSFEQADGGTLFLDEIGDLPLLVQAKLLRVLQGQCYYRLGSERPIQVDVRIVAATHRHLSERVAANQFREDLFFRLNVVALRLPPLRARIDDVESLVPHFLARFARQMGRVVPAVEPATLERLKQYHWPGNVRELQNTLERAMVFLDHLTLTPDDVTLGDPAGMGMVSVPGGRLHEALRETERQMIASTLAGTGGNKAAACRILGISRPTLDKKLALYGEGAQ